LFVFQKRQHSDKTVFTRTEIYGTIKSKHHAKEKVKMKQTWHPDTAVKRKDLDDPEVCAEVTLQESPRPPYNARVIFKHGTYVDIIADDTSSAEDLIDIAKAALTTAFNRGSFEPSDIPEYNEDDEEKYYDELTLTDDPFSDEPDDDELPTEGERLSDDLLLFYMEKDALEPEPIGVHVTDESSEEGFLIWETDELTETEEYSQASPRPDVNTPEECVRLASIYDPPYEGWVRVIFSHGTFVDVADGETLGKEALIAEAMDYLDEASRNSGYDSLYLSEDENNEYGDYIAFLYQSYEMGCMNGVFNFFWERNDESVEKQIIALRTEDYNERKIVRILTCKDFPDNAD
jgi:hypothetical protein